MTKNEIIEQWFREGVVQNIVRKVSKGSTDAKWDDLVQIVYMYLLEKPDELIHKMYEDRSYNYLAAKMVMRQVTSYHSKWYYDTRRMWAYNLGDEVPGYFNAVDKTEKELTELYNDLANYLTDDERETVGLYLYYGSVVDMAKAKGIDNIRSAEGQAYRRNFKKVIDKLHLLRASEEKGWKPSPRKGTSSPLSTRQYDSKK